MESVTIAAVRAREFMQLSQEQFHNNGENGFSRKLKQWESPNLLLIDGPDRVAKWSERTEGDLAGLLECRHERKPAVIWTTNAPSEHLWSRFQRQAVTGSDDPDPIHVDLGGVRWHIFAHCSASSGSSSGAVVASSFGGLSPISRLFIRPRDTPPDTIPPMSKIGHIGKITMAAK